MSSWVKCKCEQLVHTNLFCGTGISLIVEEDFLDEERPNMSAEDFISELVVTRNDVARLFRTNNYATSRYALS
jgi:hypothetical protein